MQSSLEIHLELHAFCGRRLRGTTKASKLTCGCFMLGGLGPVRCQKTHELVVTDSRKSWPSSFSEF